jgi:hypothetical protein
MNLMNSSRSFDCGAAIQKPRMGSMLTLSGFELSDTCEDAIPQIANSKIGRICFIGLLNIF